MMSSVGGSLVICLLITWLHPITSTSFCSSICSCFLDRKGRNTVACSRGGMDDLSGINLLNPNMEIIKISAPEDNLNSLTMGPIFQKFINLEELQITRSNIPELGKHFFWGLKKLEILNLSQNNITQPLWHNFLGLFNLKELYLDDNRIESLPSSTFRNLTELRLLSIQRNRIQAMMPRIFDGLSKLRTLKLSGNNLQTLDAEAFEDVQELKTFECRGCGLQKIDSHVFKPLPHLIHLDLGDNKFKHISGKDFLELKKLRSLKLDGNKLTVIQDNIFYQSELSKLSLARNLIVKVSSAAFANLKNLSDLDLGYNQLDYLDGSVLKSIRNSLQRLVLTGNHISISVIKPLIGSGSKLQELHLARTGLTDVPSGFLPENLTVLNLAENHLSFLPSYVIPKQLVELDISRNQFRGLDEPAAQYFEHIQRLKLDRNPWSCDLCHIIPMLERTNRSAAMYNIECVSPRSCKGQLLGTISRNKLSWCTAPSYATGDANYFLVGEDGRIGIIAAGTSVVLLLLTCLAVIAAVVYSRRHAAKYYTHEEKRAGETEAIFDNQGSLFGDERELSFKFPMDLHDKKISIATIDEIKKDHGLVNGT